MNKAKTDKIRDFVKEFYKNSSDNCMSGWFYDHHVKHVAKYAEQIAQEYNINVELSVLSALFHDIAGATVGFDDDNKLMNETLKITEKIMRENNYSQEDINEVKIAIIPHSCKDKFPTTDIGKVLATADALGHLLTDVYLVLPICDEEINDEASWNEYKEWIVKKIDRDINNKIFFEKYRKLAYPRYEAIKSIFSTE